MPRRADLSNRLSLLEASFSVKQKQRYCKGSPVSSRLTLVRPIYSNVFTECELGRHATTRKSPSMELPTDGKRCRRSHPRQWNVGESPGLTGARAHFLIPCSRNVLVTMKTPEGVTYIGSESFHFRDGVNLMLAITVVENTKERVIQVVNRVPDTSGALVHEHGPVPLHRILQNAESQSHCIRDAPSAAGSDSYSHEAFSEERHSSVFIT